MVPLQVRLANKLLGAAGHLAWEGVLSLVVVCLHMRLEVVATAEELAATLDSALEVGFLLRGVPSGWAPLSSLDSSPPSRRVWQRGWRCGVRSHHLAWQAWMKRGLVALTLDVMGKEDLVAAAEGLSLPRMATRSKRTRQRVLRSLGHRAVDERLVDLWLGRKRVLSEAKRAPRRECRGLSAVDIAG